jgi:hypothetical protein
MRSDLELLERTLDGVFTKLDAAVESRRSEMLTRAVSREVSDAKGLGKELLSRLGSVERRLMTPDVVAVKAG